MIGQLITKPSGVPNLQSAKASPSAYQPPPDVKKLFAQVQRDYEIAWQLQHKPFDEFDGISLLQRTKLDQETFGAYVGAEYLPIHKRWRWRGRKNTARNKLIGILAHMLAGMLYPFVNARNQEDEPDKMTARVMRILVEDYLKKADYETKFLYMVLSALVNPAVIVEVQYLEAYQKIKEQLANGDVKITDAIDTFLSGLNLSIIPIDQFYVADFYTNEIQKQPYIIRVRRVSYDTAKKIFQKRFYQDEKDLFDYVEAGKTRTITVEGENATLYDMEWTEADKNYVQWITAYYRDEDLELDWVGGVGMFNYKNPYNTNPFAHRRMSLIDDEWKLIPIYPYGKTYFEPLDPTGRFFYGKSGAFKLYWDDATQNKMHQLLIDGTHLDVIKVNFLSGVAKNDSTVMVPGANVFMPNGATITPYSMGPNLAAAMSAMNKQEQDESESTQDKIMSGITEPNVTATQSIQAQNQAKIFLGVFGAMVGDLIRQVGELVMDCIVVKTTEGALDASIPEALKMKYKIILAKGKDRGKNITNRIVFTDALMGRPMTEQEKTKYEYALFKKAGGEESDQRIYHVNPFRFQRTLYSMSIDVDQMINKSMGNDRLQQQAKAQALAQPFVYPFVDKKQLADDIIEEWAEGDPDRLKAKGNVDEMLQAVMSNPSQTKGASVGAPSPEKMN